MFAEHENDGDNDFEMFYRQGQREYRNTALSFRPYFFSKSILTEINITLPNIKNALDFMKFIHTVLIVKHKFLY